MKKVPVMNYIFMIVIIPFLIGAVINFTPIWFWIPFTLVFGALFIGSCIVIAEGRYES